jgi:hypothetical protein
MFKYLCLWYLTLIVSGPVLAQQVLATAEFDPGINPIEEQGRWTGLPPINVDICADSAYA